MHRGENHTVAVMIAYMFSTTPFPKPTIYLSDSKLGS